MARAASVVIKEVAQGLAELHEILDGRVSDTEVGGDIKAMIAVCNSADAAMSRLAGELDATITYALDGAFSAWQWMAATLQLEKPVAAAIVRDARSLRHMPATSVAYAAGALGTGQVRLLALAQRTNGEAFVDAEDYLLGNAQRMSFADLRRTVDYWRYHADPDRGKKDAKRRHELRSVQLTQTFQNMWDLKGSLEPVAGTVFANELDRIERHLFAQDWQAAEQRLGRKPTLVELGRTTTQRRHDALIEMATRSFALPDGTERPRPLITYVVGHPVWPMISQLANGTPVTPDEALPLLHDFDIERVVFGPESRVVDVGVTRRFFTGATRRAIEVRDLRCTHPTCDEPYERCEVDHVQPWAVGGPTTQGNGRCACPRHNRRRPRSNLDGGDADDW